MVAKFVSMKRSTQLARHVCSLLSSALLLMLPVTHFFQQMLVSSWVSFLVMCFGLVSLRPRSSFAPLFSLLYAGASGGRGIWVERFEEEGEEGDGMKRVRDWIRARCPSLEKNWRSSALSLSLSFSRSDCSMEKSVEDIFLPFFGSLLVGVPLPRITNQLVASVLLVG